MYSFPINSVKNVAITDFPVAVEPIKKNIALASLKSVKTYPRIDKNKSTLSSSLSNAVSKNFIKFSFLASLSSLPNK